MEHDRATSPHSLRRATLLFFSLSLVLTACGPSTVPDDDSFTRGQEEEVKKPARGEWISDCTPFEDGGSWFSERRTLSISAQSPFAHAETFVGKNCTGERVRDHLFSGDARSLSVVPDDQRTEPNPSTDTAELVLTLRAARAVDYAAYQIVLRLTVRREALIAQVERLSYWEHGQELWIPSEDLKPLPPTTYRRR